MKKTFLLMAIAFAVPVLAQKKYEKIVYKDVTAEAGPITISTKDIVATKAVTKFQLKFNNKSDRILLYKAEESNLKIAGKDRKPNEKMLIVFPGETDHRTININGTDLMVNDYQFTADGLYLVSETERE